MIVPLDLPATQPFRVDSYLHDNAIGLYPVVNFGTDPASAPGPGSEKNPRNTIRALYI